MDILVDREDFILINGDCREVLPAFKPSMFSLVLTDPPYGVSGIHNNKERGRSISAPAQDYPPVINDDKPFDPTHLLVYPRLILFGANYYAEKLPASPSWFVWDKLNGLTTEKRKIGFNDSADIELVWSNLGGAARIIPHRWIGYFKDSEHKDKRVHPTQKPIALMQAFIEHYTEPGDWICDPYCGAGSTAIAALQCNRSVVAIELSLDYCNITLDRITKLGL